MTKPNPQSPIPNPNSEQRPVLADWEAREAISAALDDTLIVEAAAGTGKTTELVHRIVRVIETGRAQVTEIVSVTFTEKAAGELKLRLREKLEESRGAAAAGSDERKRLDEAVRRLEEAQISTIHGFCADLLRERPVEARVDPLFAVLTEPQAARLYDAAFQMWFQEQLSNPPEGIQRSLRRPTFAGFGPGAVNDDGPVERLRHAGWELIQWRDFEGDWQRPPFDRERRIDALVQRLREFAELSDGPAYQYDAFCLDTRPARQLSDEIARMENVAPRDYSRLEGALVDLCRNRQFRQARKGSGKQYRPGVAREHVTRARDDLHAELTQFEMDANADLAALLREELRGCADRYEQAKAKAGALDFLDLLLKARNLVRDDAAVRRSFQQRFKRLFVDEFQDTDPLQAEILLLLASDDPTVTDWRKVRPIPGKLFIVGDPKQSIYRFRRADVGIYRGVYEMLQSAGAKPVTLRTSFRARPNIQRTINAAFAPAMTGDVQASQASYVPLEPFRSDSAEQPSVVVLPVPEPYGKQRIANASVEESLPDAVGAYVDWLINKSGWKVAERASNVIAVAQDFSPALAVGFQPGERERLVPIQARHICLLFRRFVSFGDDMTRPYVRALEARGVPHLLVGGRSFHNRGEIETLRAALAAIEWPDDELSVFATLRGALFAIGDEELLEYRDKFGAFHPFRIPQTSEDGVVPSVGSALRRTVDGASSVAQDFNPALRPIVDALSLLQRLHRSRNHVSVATTISTLLDSTRAHVRFALEHGGEQVLANVLHVAELARRYEADGGISFRGFIEELREQAEDGQAGEAPILEEGSDGVRLMTVHKAKGLEFPVVILADMTAKIRSTSASRYIDSERGACAIRIAGCSPFDLIQHEPKELARDEAEGVRLAYVAATRARDLLVVPAVGDEAREGWIDPINRAIYPPNETRRDQVAAPGCPAFKSKDSVLMRPNGDPANSSTVSPGLHVFDSGPFLTRPTPPTIPTPPSAAKPHSIVWWDGRNLELKAEPPLGIRRSELIVKDVAARTVEEGLADYTAWRTRTDAAVSEGSHRSVAAQTVTQWSKTATDDVNLKLPKVKIVEVPREADRPTGIRFGALVHAVLGTVPLDGDADLIRRVTELQARTLGSTDEEVESAAKVVHTVLALPILARAREAAKAHRCRRETPIAWRHGDTLIEGVIDLAFEDGSRWMLVDFKTDEEFRSAAPYQRQLGLYALAVGQAFSTPVSAFLIRI
ncbi:MAG TPA: UvrD-helicase domain-containing protein [Vicinamibacterales bacterium]|nr:UvrD-helicase domain-containing protein [Vicinamibacterales bacterium]